MIRVGIFVLLMYLLLLSAINPVFSVALTGGVEKEEYLRQNRLNIVVDSITGNPIKNAEVSLPSKGIFLRTDTNGYFSLDVDFNGPAILGIKADGYKPFSLTIEAQDLNNPLIVGVEKRSSQEIVIDSDLHHLGDNNFSNESSNAGEFRLKSNGHHFSKGFNFCTAPLNQSVFLRIGSIIGIDTEMAHKLGQNNAISSSSSPANIYLNSQKLGELRINGDNQLIPIPINLLKQNSYNEIIVETGRNLHQTRYVDYDDMEFMNLILEFR